MHQILKQHKRNLSVVRFWAVHAISAFVLERSLPPRAGIKPSLDTGVKLAEIGWNFRQRHKETNTKDFSSVYFNLFLVILTKFESLFYTRNPIQTLIWHPVACVTIGASVSSTQTKFCMCSSLMANNKIYYSASTVCFRGSNFAEACILSCLTVKHSLAAISVYSFMNTVPSLGANIW